MRWYEEEGPKDSVAVATRIRIDRNLQDYCFPERMDADERGKLTEQLLDKLSALPEAEGKGFVRCRPERLKAAERSALAERLIISKTCRSSPAGTGLFLSKDESVSIMLNSVNHLRMQISHAGLDLNNTWQQLDALDDSVNQFCTYAFDEKFGYRTTYPTNVGTGMKAFLVLHLPKLSALENFADVVSEIGRYSLQMPPAFGKSGEKSSSLYVMSNRRTLGMSERDALEVMENVAGQLIRREEELRKEDSDKNRLRVQDGCCRAYGTLRYARLMPLPQAMSLLSELWLGYEEGIVELDRPVSFYRLMMGIQPGNLSVFAQRTLTNNNIEQVRAAYIRKQLPLLKTDDSTPA